MKKKIKNDVLAKKIEQIIYYNNELLAYDLILNYDLDERYIDIIANSIVCKSIDYHLLISVLIKSDNIDVLKNVYTRTIINDKDRKKVFYKDLLFEVNRVLNILKFNQTYKNFGIDLDNGLLEFLKNITSETFNIENICDDYNFFSLSLELLVFIKEYNKSKKKVLK